MPSVPIFCQFEVCCSQVQNCFKLGKELAPKAHVQVKFCSDPVRSEDYFPEWKPAFRPLQLSYAAANPRHIEAYLIMFSGTGKLFYNAGNDISRDDFGNGYALYPADLTPDMCGSSDHFNVVQHRNLAVDIKFSTAPTDAVSLVCYGEFKNTIHIDSERNVVYDYSG